MSTEEGIQHLFNYCKSKSEKSLINRLLFPGENIILERTEILEDYQKEVNLALPLQIENGNLIIDKKGIQNRNLLYPWKNIIATLIKKIYDQGKEIYNYSLLVCLEDMSVLELPLDYFDQYGGNFGHFIELYKRQHHSQSE